MAQAWLGGRAYLAFRRERSERYLIPHLGRWSTPDPLHIHAVGGGEALNSYHYISGNLLQARDPLGLREFESHEEYDTAASNEGFESLPAEEIGSQGHWLSTDREEGTAVWQQANQVNLQAQSGFKEYRTIEQRADFYDWFQEAAGDTGHQIRWAGAASDVANLANLMGNSPLVTAFLGRTGDEMRLAAHKGNRFIFGDVFGKLRDLYNSDVKLTGAEARRWDAKVLAEEQQLVQPMYESMSFEARVYWELAAKHDGPFSAIRLLLEPMDLYVKPMSEGSDIMNPLDRWRYGMRTMGHDSSLRGLSDVRIGEEYATGQRYRELESRAP